VSRYAACGGLLGCRDSVDHNDETKSSFAAATKRGFMGSPTRLMGVARCRGILRCPVRRREEGLIDALAKNAPPAEASLVTEKGLRAVHALLLCDAWDVTPRAMTRKPGGRLLTDGEPKRWRQDRVCEAGPVGNSAWRRWRPEVTSMINRLYTYATWAAGYGAEWLAAPSRRRDANGGHLPL